MRLMYGGIIITNNQTSTVSSRAPVKKIRTALNNAKMFTLLVTGLEKSWDIFLTQNLWSRFIPQIWYYSVIYSLWLK